MTRTDQTPTSMSMCTRPERIGSKYELLRVLKHGPGTVLYEARNVMTQRPVQVELLDVPDDGVNVRRRFLREARLAAQMAHANVVSVYDVGETRSGSLYMVREQVGGEQLSRYLRRNGPMRLSETAEVVLPLMDALASAHQQGFVHGSISAEQIELVALSRSRRVPKLLDLGLTWELSRLGIDRLAVRGRDDGGSTLVPPEQLTNETVTDARVDVWGVSAVIYHCLTGRRPFQSTSPSELARDVLQTEPPAASAVRSGIHPDIDEFLSKGLSRDPDARFASMRSTMLELSALVRSGVGDWVEGEQADSDDAPTAVFQSSRPPTHLHRASALERPLRFGLLVPGQIEQVKAAAAALAEAFDGPCEVYPCASYAELVEAIGEGEVDLAWLPPVAFVRAQHAGGAQLLLSVERSGATNYACALLGRRGEVDRLEDVRGKRAAWVDKWSAAGYLVPRTCLVERGIDPDTELRSQGFVGSYDAVLEALSNGSAQVGAAYCGLGKHGRIVRSAWSDHHPVTVLAVRGSIPTETICGRPDLDVGTAMKVIRALRSPEQSAPLRSLLGASRFVIADPKHYDALSKAF